MKIEIKRCFKSEDLLNKEFTNEYGTNEVCIRKCGIPLYEVTLIHNDKKKQERRKNETETYYHDTKYKIAMRNGKNRKR